MPADCSDLLTRFEAGAIEPAQFHHREHVRVSYELLARYPFPEALLHLARGLRRLATKAGKPEAYHETITGAFLALIAERRSRGACSDADDFLARHPELLRKELLSTIYDPERLHSAVARNTFILPGNAIP